MGVTSPTDGWHAKASRTSSSARLLLSDRDFDSACSSAYYTTFYSAHVVLIASGYREAASAIKTNRGLIALFGREAIKTGRSPADVGKTLACVMLLLTHACSKVRGCSTASIEAPLQRQPDRL